MEKYREIRWNKELEILRKINTTKEQKPTTPQEPLIKNHIKEKTMWPHEGKDLTLKIMLGVALGIILAGIIEGIGWILVSNAVIKGFTDALQQITPASQINSIPDTAKLLQQPIEKVIKQDIRTLNPPTPRNEIIRRKSEAAVMQARKEAQAFDAQYQKPEECYNIKNQATRIKCAIEYMRAKAKFSKN